MRLRLEMAALAMAGLFTLTGGAAFANPLIFTGQNAALFPEANPSDTSAMMNSVVKPNNPSPASETPLTTDQLILQQLSSSLVTADLNAIENAGVGSNPSSGTFNIGTNGTISYQLIGGGLVQVTINDNGTTTTLTIPAN